MALSAGTVSLGVKADAKGFGANLASDLSREAKTSGLSGIGSIIGGTIMAGIAATFVGIGAIVATGIRETMDASAGTAQLAAGIKSTGNAANVSVKGMNELATAIQGYSGQTDDSIVKSEQLLLTFTNIKNSGPNKIFDQATIASANMAAKMGGDASSNAILLGKALNDPVKGLTALTRVGVAFTQGQKDSIAAMVASGDTVGAQKVILAELTSEFGGAAEAAGKSLPGQLKRGQRAFEDMSQSVVESLLPIVMPAITGIAGAVKSAAPFVIAFAETFSKNLQNAIKDNAPLIKNVRDVIGGLGSFIGKTLMPALMGFGKWLVDNKTLIVVIGVAILSAVVAFKAYHMVMGIIKIATIGWAVVQAILNGTLIANPIGLIVMAIAALVAGIIWVATQTTFFQDAWKVMSEAVGAAWNWLWATVLQPVFALIGAIFGWLWTVIIQPIVSVIVIYVQIWAAIFIWLWQTILSPVFAVIGAIFTWLWTVIIQPIVNEIVAYVKIWADIFTWLWTTVIQPVASFIGDAIRVVGDVIGTVFGAIGGVIRGAFNGVVEFVKGIFNTIGGLVNGIIDGVNGATSLAAGVGITIGKIPHIPRLAAGGTIPATPGGRLVRVAEGGRAESVVDTGKLNSLMDAARSTPVRSSTNPDTPVKLHKASIDDLARALAGYMRVQSRQGAVVF